MTDAFYLMAAKSGGTDPMKWLPYYIHAEDTAGIIGCLCEKWLPAATVSVFEPLGLNEFKRLCRFVALVHDIGKVTPVFQVEIASVIEGHLKRLANVEFILPQKVAGKLRHAEAGEMILQHSGCPAGIAAVIGAHHGVTQRENMKAKTEFDHHSDLYFYGQKNEWITLWGEIFSHALDVCGYASAAELPTISMRQQMVLSGLLIAADWIASNTRYFQLIETESAVSPDCCRERIKAGWSAIRLPDALQLSGFGMDSETFTDRFGFLPNEIQRLAINAADHADRLGLMIIEAQMGLGKTEAALAVSEIVSMRSGSGGVFFGLPTQATANGIFPRLISWAEKLSEDARLSVVLAHAMAEFNEDYRALFEGNADICEDDSAGLTVHSWFKGQKLALLGNFVIGTIDQLLMMALHQRHVMLRHLGLAGKVIIIDEVHAYDAYMCRYLERALNWLGVYRAPVILLSATLPTARREALIKAYTGRRTLPDTIRTDATAYPLITWTDNGEIYSASVEAGGESKQIMIRHITDKDRIATLADSLADGGCACVIVNTVKRAQKLAEVIKTALPDAETMLFHAQFVMPDRLEREREILRRFGKRSDKKSRDKLIVIGTQVLEQSLDIDFDVMITDLCPMDLLLQRIGRLQRFRFFDSIRPERLRQPVCYVVYEPDELEDGAKAIYGEWLLLRTRDLLKEKIILPDDIPLLVNDTYNENEFTGEHQKEWVDYETDKKTARSRADVYCLGRPAKDTAKNSIGLIDGLMNNVDANISDTKAQAAVRDGDPSLEVIVLMEKDGQVRFLPWQYDGAAVMADRIPSDMEQRKIIRQRLRLPGVFCRDYIIDATINALDAATAARFGEWQYAPLLRGEHVLLLDETGKAELCGYALRYSRELGLTYEKII